MKYICPHCGTPIGAPVLTGEERLGVRMTAFKARIFDIVARAGQNGILTDDLWRLAYHGKIVRPGRRALLSHIQQINDLLEDTGFRLVGHTGWHHYRLVYRGLAQIEAAE